MNEIWKDIEGFEGFYQVSNLGEVRSLSRCLIQKNGNEKKYEGKVLIKIFRNNYHKVDLRKNGIIIQASVHREVAKAFIPNPENKQQVNHKNGIKTDNRVENLEWVTGSENQKHSFSNGLNKAKNGEDHNNAKLTKNEAIKIKYLHNDLNNCQVARIYNVCRQTVQMIRNGKRWKNI